MLKKIFASALALACLLSISPIANLKSISADELKKIDTLNVAFVPSRDPDEIVTATKPLEGLMKDALKKQGYDVANVNITVGTSFEIVGESLAAGTVDIGFIPGGTYVLYDDGADVILTATRNSVKKDSDNAKDWNDGEDNGFTDKQTTSYRSLFIAGPSEQGKKIAEKVNKGEELTFEDLDACNFSVMNTTSPAGYIYPSILLQDKFGKSITDLKHIVQSDSYGSAMARLASGQVDVVLAYSDVRNDYKDKWTSEFGRTEPIWKETNVIEVTPPIYNDTICVSKNSEVMDDDLKLALQKAFIEIGNSDEGKEVIAIYSHNGYKEAKSEDYDNERRAQDMIKKMSENK